MAALSSRRVGGGSPAEALELARFAPLDELLFVAGRVREAHFGNRVECCSIANVRGGNCTEDCKFCAQSGHYATDVEPTDLLDESAVRRAAGGAREHGATGFGLVAAGCSLSLAALDEYCQRLKAVAEEGIPAHASLGTLDVDGARQLAAAGLRVYNHNLEAARSFFPEICTTHDYDRRLATLAALKEAGIERCSGGIFGVGESWDQRAELGAELARLEVERVPINFLNPIPGTPFEGREPLTAREGLRIISLFRLMLPVAQIQVCGGRELVLGPLQPLAFAAGATGVILGNYLTTRGRPAEDDLAMFSALGLELVQ